MKFNSKAAIFDLFSTLICEYFGHKWEPVYVKGSVKKVKLKFIGCYCKRCYKGRKELSESVFKIKTEYATFKEMF